jgi:hypothetical protein
LYCTPKVAIEAWEIAKVTARQLSFIYSPVVCVSSVGIWFRYVLIATTKSSRRPAVNVDFLQTGRWPMTAAGPADRIDRLDTFAQKLHPRRHTALIPRFAKASFVYIVVFVWRIAPLSTASLIYASLFPNPIFLNPINEILSYLPLHSLNEL